MKLCRDCRRMQELDQFPTDKWGRVKTLQCLTCLDEHTPVLLNESEAAQRLGVAVEQFRSHDLTPAGSYSPPGKGAVIPLFARTEVDALVMAVTV